MKEGIGDEFQRKTKYQRGSLPRMWLDWSRRPGTYKVYADRPRMKLPEPKISDGPPIWSTIADRRSVRNFLPEPLNLDDVSQLLWASQGITARVGGYELRAAPSAGALYPVETYLVANDVNGTEPGIYHYHVPSHELELLKRGDFRRKVSQSALDQEAVHGAPVVFIWTGVFERSKWKYADRAYRYVYLDAGHIAQNLALGAVALGLGSCQIGALYDDEVNSILGVDGKEESVVYMSLVGRPAP